MAVSQGTGCLLVVLAIVAVLGVISLLTEDSTPPRTSEPSSRPAPTTAPATKPAPERSLEYKLAVIHKGGYVAEDDPLVAQFGRALDRLEAKCPESRQQISDMGVKGQELLRNDGINEPLLDVFTNWWESIPADAEDGELGRCSDILAAYIALRVGRR